MLDRFGPGARTQIRDQVATGGPIAGRDPDLDELVVGQGALELAHDRIGEPVPAEADDRLAPVRPGAEVGNLGPSEHQQDDSSTEPASVAREVAPALAAIKRELAAILLVAAAGAPVVIHYLEGARELGVLAAYGVGAGLWVHTRARGVLLALRRARRVGGRDGA